MQAPAPVPNEATGAPPKWLPKTRVVHLVLLGAAALGYIAWLGLLGTVAAAQIIADHSILGLSWAITFGFLALLVTLTAFLVIGLRMPHVLHLGINGLLFFLAILMAWAGTQAHFVLQLVEHSPVLPLSFCLPLSVQGAVAILGIGSPVPFCGGETELTNC